MSLYVLICPYMSTVHKDYSQHEKAFVGSLHHAAHLPLYVLICPYMSLYVHSTQGLFATREGVRGLAIPCSSFALICPYMSLYVLICPQYTRTIRNTRRRSWARYTMQLICPYMSLYVLICPYMSTVHKDYSQHEKAFVTLLHHAAPKIFLPFFTLVGASLDLRTVFFFLKKNFFEKKFDKQMCST